MIKALFYIIFTVFVMWPSGTYASTGNSPQVFAAAATLDIAGENTIYPETGQPVTSAAPAPAKTPQVNELHAAATPAPAKDTADLQDIIVLLLQCIFAGLLAVFTPYMYTIHPFTTGYLSRNTKTPFEKLRNNLLYAFSLMTIFTLLGVVVSVIIKFTGVGKFTEHWIFNVFFLRIFFMLGISFLGAFAIKLPESWINSMAKKAKSNNLKGIFFMAFTLPGASFSSTFPIIGLVLLFACKVSVFGPIIGLMGFAIGLSLPFIFPSILNIFVKSKSVLNNIKVIMGFFSLMIALKFTSKADISLGLNLISRDLFIEIWMILWAIMGVYMLGMIKLSHDTETELNIYGQEYIPLSRLFIAITSLVFALYLLPGVWGAPLRGVSGFLPH